MPVNPSSNRQQTLWAQLQTGGPRTIQNSSGTWTSTGAVRLRYDSFTLTPANPVNRPQYKTGNRSPMIGARGRQGVSWTLPKEFIPSGAAGTAPDDDILLQSIMGAAKVVVASTSVTYNLGETLYYLFMPRYNKTPGLSSPTNAYVLGGIPQNVKFTGGGNFLMYTIDGVGVGAGDSQNFSSYTAGFDSILGGGLTTYPAEPGSFSPLGNVIPGFGSGAGFKFGGSAMAEVRGTVEIAMSLGIDVIGDAINDPYPIGFVSGLRTIQISKIQCIDSDGSILNNLKIAATTKSANTITMQFGNVAGSIVTFTINNVQAGAMTWQENGAALDVSFDNNGAAETTISAADDLSIALT